MVWLLNIIIIATTVHLHSHRQILDSNEHGPWADTETDSPHQPKQIIMINKIIIRDNYQPTPSTYLVPTYF